MAYPWPWLSKAPFAAVAVTKIRYVVKLGCYVTCVCLSKVVSLLFLFVVVLYEEDGWKIAGKIPPNF